MVPKNIPPIRATAKGACNSAPNPFENNNGINARIVVKLVIKIGFSLLCPATNNAFNKE